MFGAFVGAFFGVGMRAWANKLGKQHTLARKTPMLRLIFLVCNFNSTHSLHLFDVP